MLRLTCTLLVVVILIVAGAVRAQTRSGTEDYDLYCGACHGLDGSGNGTWKGAKVPDLTRLSWENGGNFPSEEVRNVVDGRSRSRWHQRQLDMPYVGEVFESEQENHVSNENAETRTAAIVDYIRGLQKENH
jgi:hypothetical protein